MNTSIAGFVSQCDTACSEVTHHFYRNAQSTYILTQCFNFQMYGLCSNVTFPQMSMARTPLSTYNLQVSNVLTVEPAPFFMSAGVQVKPEGSHIDAPRLQCLQERANIEILR